MWPAEPHYDGSGPAPVVSEPEGSETTSTRPKVSLALLKASGIFAALLAMGALGSWSVLTGIDRSELRPAPALLSSSHLDTTWLPALRDGDGGVKSRWKKTRSAPKRPHEDNPRGLTRDGKVILNLAEIDVLQRLPGVGQRRAAAIIRLRKRLGKFRRLADLLRIRGIGPKSLRRMKPHLVLNPPSRDAGTDH